MGEQDERLDVEAAIDRLNGALSLQYRSALQLTLASGSVVGFELQAVGEKLWQFATDDLRDARRLVEKVVALGGEPTDEVAPLRWTKEPQKMVELLIEQEQEAIEALQEVIETTGREGRSEALEHLMEHLILRKQDQVDFLLRAGSE